MTAFSRLRKIFGLLAALGVIMGAGPGLSTARADPVVRGEEHCVINVRSEDVLNLRRGPGTRHAVLAGLRYGQCGIIVTAPCQGDWCAVEDGHRAGFVHRHFIAMVSPARYCVTGVAPGDRLNLRAFPAPTSRIVGVLPPHACGIAMLPYRVGNWQKVRVEGIEAWAHRTYLSGQ